MKYMDKTAFDAANLFGLGGPNDAYAKYFVGQSYLASLPAGALHISNVTFEPGCRNNWHIHTATQGGGQVLLCIAGEGWYQEEGKPAVSLTPGCVVHIPAGVKALARRQSGQLVQPYLDRRARRRRRYAMAGTGER